jgi:hypothetical protein
VYGGLRYRLRFSTRGALDCPGAGASSPVHSEGADETAAASDAGAVATPHVVDAVVLAAAATARHLAASACASFSCVTHTCARKECTLASVLVAWAASVSVGVHAIVPASLRVHSHGTPPKEGIPPHPLKS